MTIPNIVFLLALMAVMGLLLSVIFGFLKDKIRQRDVIIQKQNESEVQTRSIIANRLHSEVGGSLLMVQQKIEDTKVVTDILAKRFADIEDLQTEVERILTDIKNARTTLADIYESTYPRQLSTMGLIPVCEELLRKKQENFGGMIVFRPEGDFELLNQKSDDDERDARLKTIKFNLYNVINLFVTNSVLHSQANTILVSLRQTDGRVRLYIKDDGRGFDMKAVKATSIRRGIFDIEAVVFSLDKKGRYFSQIGIGTELEAEVTI
jgi:two-component system, NarL family, sensor kinase